MRHVLLIALASLSVSAQSPQVRIHVGTQNDSATLRALDLDLATCSCGSVHPGRDVDVFIHRPADERALIAAGFRPQLIHADAQAFYRNRLQQIGTHFGPPAFASGSMGGFFTFAETVAYMDALQAQYPSLMSPKTSLGLSLEGRDIWMWKVSDNPNLDEAEPEVLVDGLHHAREPMTIMAACWLAKTLCENYGVDPEATALVDERELFIVPMVNPDGLVWNQTTNPGGGGLWRKNRRPNADGSVGIDLNRNYGYQWGLDNQGSSPTPSSQTYRGTAPFSEPETLAMKTFAESRNLNVGYSMHSYSNFFFIPPGYQTGTYAPPPLDTRYATLAQNTLALGPGWVAGTPWEILYPANGTTQDWWFGSLYGGLQTWAFGCEIGSAQDGFWPPTSRIVPLAQDAYRYATYVMQIAGSDFDLVSVSTVDVGGALPGTWEPGETIQIDVTVANRGTEAGAATATIETTDPALIVTSPATALGTIPAFGSTASSSSMTLTVAAGATPFSTVTYDLVITGPDAVPTRVTRHVTLNSATITLVDDDFEAPSGWTVGLPGDNASLGVWTRTDPNGSSYQGQPFNPSDDHTPAPGTDCWFTGQGNPGQSVGAQDVDGTTTLVSPVFDLAHIDNPEIRYWRWFATSGNDLLEVGLSNDGGQTWTVIDTLTATQNTWTEIVYAVEAWLPRTSAMRIYFRAQDDPNNSLCEAAIDDFRVVGASPGADLVASGSGSIGTTVLLDLSAPAFAGGAYFLGVSGSAGTGFPVPPAGIAPLDIDFLFTAFPGLPTIFANFSGTTNAQGLAQGQINVPNDPSLSGLSVVVAGLVLTNGTPAAITGGVRLTVP